MRKLRSTEISGKVNTPNSQWRQKADFCLNCHGVNMHYNENEKMLKIIYEAFKK